MYSQLMFNEYDQGTDTAKDSICIYMSRQVICCSGGRVLAYLPAAHTEQEAHDIALLLLLKLLEVFVGAHLCSLVSLGPQTSFANAALVRFAANDSALEVLICTSVTLQSSSP